MSETFMNCDFQRHIRLQMEDYTNACKLRKFFEKILEQVYIYKKSLNPAVVPKRAT